MLQLLPSCEHCDAPLPPASTSAMICSFECTFCRECALQRFHNVCPNCGGGFQPRPIRPASPHRPPWFLGAHPPCDRRSHRPKDLDDLRAFIVSLEDVDPAAR